MHKIVIFLRLYLVPTIIVSIAIGLYYAVFVVVYDKNTDLTHAISAIYGEDKKGEKVIASSVNEEPIIEDLTNSANKTKVSDTNKILSSNGVIRYKTLVDTEIYSKADTKSNVLSVVKQGSSIDVLAVHDDWLELARGWVFNDEKKLEIVKADIYAGVEVKADMDSITSEAKESAKAEESAKKEEVALAQKAEDESNNKKPVPAVVAKTEVKKVEEPKSKVLATYVTKKKLNIREEPSIKSSIVGKLAMGEDISIVGRKSRWGKLERGGYVYIDKRFVNRTSQAKKEPKDIYAKFKNKYQIISRTLRVRERATVKSHVVAVLHKGDLIVNYRKKGNWLEISKDMWVYNSDRFLEKVSAGVPTALSSQRGRGEAVQHHA